MSRASPGTTPAQKEILAVLSYEWMATSDIAGWIGKTQGATIYLLKTLHKAGLIERKWDPLLGCFYWRLPEGEAFHRASTEKKGILCACGCGRMCYPRPGKIRTNKTGRFFYERDCLSRYNRDHHAGKGQKQNRGYRRPERAGA